eukprot:2258773-Pleurochrysis_carterae.AAC.1
MRVRVRVALVRVCMRPWPSVVARGPVPSVLCLCEFRLKQRKARSGTRRNVQTERLSDNAPLRGGTCESVFIRALCVRPCPTCMRASRRGSVAWH